MQHFANRICGSWNMQLKNGNRKIKPQNLDVKKSNEFQVTQETGENFHRKRVARKKHVRLEECHTEAKITKIWWNYNLKICYLLNCAVLVPCTRIKSNQRLRKVADLIIIWKIFHFIIDSVFANYIYLIYCCLLPCISWLFLGLHKRRKLIRSKRRLVSWSTEIHYFYIWVLGKNSHLWNWCFRFLEVFNE